MAKKKDNGESQEATFPPAPTVLDTPVPSALEASSGPVGEMGTDTSGQQQFTVVEERPVPKALSVLINNSNTTLQETQQRLMGDINDSANDLMGLMSISQEEGWLLDIEGQRFVRVEPAQAQ